MREREFTLITGGAGFIGSNLADSLLSNGTQVVLFDNLCRSGVERNVRWLLERYGSKVRLEVGDITDASQIAPLVRESARVYHLAAQVAVTSSVQDPRADLENNLMGTFNVLEAARSIADPPAILFTSTNKVYGALDDVPIRKYAGGYCYADGRDGIDEGAQLDFHSPYGCSKGAADQYVRDYARIFGVPTVVLRMSCVYGRRQFGTEDQGWVAHFARALLAGAPITIFGDGHQVRDILWVGDLVEAMRTAMDRVTELSGEVFNIGGGASNAVSVRAVIDRLTEITAQPVTVETAPWRVGDQKIYVSDTSKAEKLLDWEPRTPWNVGLERLVEWLQEAGLSTPVQPLEAIGSERELVRAAS